MEKNIRNIRQQEFKEIWINSKRCGILHLCPRTGKTRVGVLILKELEKELLHIPKVLILYPDEKIRDSWKAEFEICDWNDEKVIYSHYLSTGKYTEETYDLIILDEVHSLSTHQIEMCQKLFVKNKQILALTGTLAKETEKLLRQALSLHVEAVYPIELAIKEGVISDYQIEVIRVPLDNKIIQKYKKPRTEKQQFDALSHVITKLVDERKDTFFLRLTRMRLIQNSLAKLNKTKELLNNNEDRTLVFCGTTAICDKLGIPSYHNKSKESKIFEDFSSGIGSKLAVCKIGGSGITYKPLSRVILNSFDSNEEILVQKLMRTMSFEYDNPEKVAKIIIISSTEEIEINWLKKALRGINKDKIIWN